MHVTKTIAGCRVSSRFFRRACTRASVGRPGGATGAAARGSAGAGERRAGGRALRRQKTSQARHGTARHGSYSTHTTSKSLFLDNFPIFCSHCAICALANRFFSTNFSIFVEKSGFAPRLIKCLITGRRYWRPSKGQSDPQIASHSVPPKVRSPRRPPREPACGARGERCQRRPPTDEARSAGRPLDRTTGRSACRLYAPDAELAGTKVMRW